MRRRNKFAWKLCAGLVLLVMVMSVFGGAVSVSTAGSYANIEILFVSNNFVDVRAHSGGDYTQFKLYRDGVLIPYSNWFDGKFFRDVGLTKGITYCYQLTGVKDDGTVHVLSKRSVTVGEVGGNLWIDTTLPPDIYILSSSITLRDNVVLTISPGAILDRNLPRERFIVIELMDNAVLTIRPGVILKSIWIYGCRGTLNADGVTFISTSDQPYGDLYLNDATIINSILENYKIHWVGSNLKLENNMARNFSVRYSLEAVFSSPDGYATIKDNSFRNFIFDISGGASYSITGNYIINYGIWVGSTDASLSLIIKDNTFVCRKNCMYGILNYQYNNLDLSKGYIPEKLTQNKDNNLDPSKVTITNNNFCTGDRSGVCNQNPSIILNAENNWWGHPSGPRHYSNPEGIGTYVSDNVDYEPWLTSGSCGVLSRLISVYPDNGSLGDALDVYIMGQNTNFEQGVSTADFGSGITVNLLTMSSLNRATANITIHPDAEPGYRDVTVTTGEEVATGFGLFNVNVGGEGYPTAKFSYSPENPVVGMDIAFDPAPSYDPDGTIESYEWDFGDGHTDSRIRPVVAQHSYSSAGSYTVTLNVTDNDGLSDETTKLITVGESDKIELGFFCTGYDPVDKTVFYSTQSKFVNVNGTVTRADNGLPLPGANVTAYYGDMQQITAITDDRGEYFIPMLVNELGAGVEEKIVDAQLSLSEHKIVVTASKNGYQSTQVVVDYEDESEYQNLIVNGQVTDWNDIPIKDAEIRVQDWADWPHGGVITDQNGKFNFTIQIPGTEPGDATIPSLVKLKLVPLVPINLTAEKEGYQTYTHDFSLSDPIPQNFKVSGTVVAESTGDPIDGVLVTLDWPTIAQIAYTDSTGQYTIALIITEGAGPDEDVVHDFTLGQPPTANFSYLPEKPGVDIDITFDASISSDDGTIEYYNWTFDDGTEEKGRGNIIVVHNYTAAGDYEVTLNVTDDDGLSDEIRKQIIVVAPPTANFSYLPENPWVGMDITFDASISSDDGTIEYYNWTFDDGTEEKGIDKIIVVHKYTAAGTYNVSLNVTDDDGLCNETRKAITVCEVPKPILKIPALFKDVHPYKFRTGEYAPVFQRKVEEPIFNITGLTATKPGNVELVIEIREPKGRGVYANVKNITIPNSMWAETIDSDEWDWSDNSGPRTRSKIPIGIYKARAKLMNTSDDSELASSDEKEFYVIFDYKDSTKKDFVTSSKAYSFHNYPRSSVFGYGPVTFDLHIYNELIWKEALTELSNSRTVAFRTIDLTNRESVARALGDHVFIATYLDYPDKLDDCWPGQNNYWKDNIKALDAKSGTCTDYSALSIGLLRAIAIPARMVHLVGKGGLYEGYKNYDHAFFEAWYDGYWHFFDPTNVAGADAGTVGSNQYTKTGVQFRPDGQGTYNEGGYWVLTSRTAPGPPAENRYKFYNFNLDVTSITFDNPPSGGYNPGDPMTIKIDVTNTGSIDISKPSWLKVMVLVEGFISDTYDPLQDVLVNNNLKPGQTITKIVTGTAPSKSSIYTKYIVARPYTTYRGYNAYTDSVTTFKKKIPGYSISSIYSIDVDGTEKTFQRFNGTFFESNLSDEKSYIKDGYVWDDLPVELELYSEVNLGRNYSKTIITIANPDSESHEYTFAMPLYGTGDAAYVPSVGTVTSDTTLNVDASHVISYQASGEDTNVSVYEFTKDAKISLVELFEHGGFDVVKADASWNMTLPPGSSSKLSVYSSSRQGQPGFDFSVIYTSLAKEIVDNGDSLMNLKLSAPEEVRVAETMPVNVTVFNNGVVEETITLIVNVSKTPRYSGTPNIIYTDTASISVSPNTAKTISYPVYIAKETAATVWDISVDTDKEIGATATFAVNDAFVIDCTQDPEVVHNDIFPFNTTIANTWATTVHGVKAAIHLFGSFTALEPVEQQIGDLLPNERKTVGWRLNATYVGDLPIEVVVTSDDGGSDAVSATITSRTSLAPENLLPIAQFNYSPSNPAVNQMITFDASASSDPDGDITNYGWDFGDGSRGTGEIVTHSYSSAGNYNVILTVTDNDGAGAGDDKTIIIQEAGYPATPTPTHSVSLDDAVDNTGLTWSTGGDANWFGQTTTYYYGGDAAQSGAISDNQNTWIQTTVSGTGTLSFFWQVSSEKDYDYLEFYIDGDIKDRISGDVNWQRKSYTVSSGSHTLKWRYAKDKGDDYGSDCGWLDKVDFSAVSEPMPTPTPTPASTVEENFNDGQAQNWVDDGSGCWAVSDGVYVMTGNKGNENRYSYYDQELCDFTYQADVRKVAGDAIFPYTYGLVIRSGGTGNNEYSFGINVAGLYAISKIVDGEFTSLVGLSHSDALKRGYNQWNTLKVVAQGSTLQLYANGILLDTVEDTALSCGKVGLYAVDSSFSTGPDTVQFDNIIITRSGESKPTPTPPAKNQPPTNPTLTPDKSEPQSAGTAITWSASATDPDGDTLYYRFWINGPATGNSWTLMQDWSSDNTWTWYTSSDDIGDTGISVWIRDGHHEPTSSYDLDDFYEYTIVSAQTSLQKPDLVIYDVCALSGKHGEPPIIFYTIENQGNATAGPSYTELRINENFIETDYVSYSLAPGVALLTHFSTWDCTPGEEAEIIICADMGYQVDESDEANNCIIERLTCP